jgi:hypothetical protein
MAKLSDAQLAKRAATKRNNRLRKSMPLFADLLIEGGAMVNWLTSPEEQAERIRRQHEEFQKIWARWEKGDEEFKARGDARRAIVAQHLDAEALARLDQHYIKILGQYGPEYWADYWWGMLVQYVSQIAHKRCPNMNLHGKFSRWHKCCPTCNKPLAPASVSIKRGHCSAKQLPLRKAMVV